MKKYEEIEGEDSDRITVPEGYKSEPLPKTPMDTWAEEEYMFNLLAEIIERKQREAEGKNAGAVNEASGPDRGNSL